MLVLFNKTLRISHITVGRINIQNLLDFLTALLADRHKRGRLCYQGPLDMCIVVLHYFINGILLIRLSNIALSKIIK